MSVTHAHLWERDTFSHVVVLLKVREACGSPGEESRVLKRIPAHKALLSASPYLCTQLERWQDISPAYKRDAKRPRLGLRYMTVHPLCYEQASVLPDCEQQQDASKASAASPDQQQQQQQPELVLTLDSEAQETAAVAVLAALYGVSTATEQLTDEQQLHMAILADRWQVAAVADSAVSKLAARAAGAQGLSDAAQQLLLGLQAWPPCLVSIFADFDSCFGLQEAAALWDTACAPISPASLEAVVAAPHSSHMQQQLLRELGDLEEVWQVGSDKQKVLLGLPLSAMQLLLSSSELQVVSEDTVLFTAQEYVDAQTDTQLKHAAQEQLGQLVRCPDLQMSWLAAAATTECTTSVLHPLQQQVGALLRFLLVCPNATTRAARLKGLVPDAPASWLLGCRKHKRAPAFVEGVWQLPITQLKEACTRAAADQQIVSLVSHINFAPLCGRTFVFMLDCLGSSEGTKIGAFLRPCSGALNTVTHIQYSIAVHPQQAKPASCVVRAGCGYGWPDFFDLGFMPGGWDEAAWAAKGLPTTGELRLTTKVTSCC